MLVNLHIKTNVCMDHILLVPRVVFLYKFQCISRIIVDQRFYTDVREVMVLRQRAVRSWYAHTE